MDYLCESKACMFPNKKSLNTLTKADSFFSSSSLNGMVAIMCLPPDAVFLFDDFLRSTDAGFRKLYLVMS